MFGITPLGNNYVLKSGMAPDCVVFYQACTMAAVCRLVCGVRKISVRVSGKDALSLMLLGVIGIGLTDFFLNSAMTKMQVSSVIMLHFLYPTIVMLASVLLFRQRVSRLGIFAMVLSLTGLVLVTDFSGEITPAGAMFAILSALAYALFVTANEHGDFNRHSLLVKLLYMSCGVMLVYGCKAGIGGKLSVPASASVWAVLVLIVGIVSLLGFYFIAAGVKCVGASKVAFLNMLEPITSVIGGVLLFHDNISVRGALGCTCVLVSALLVGLEDARKERTETRA